MSERFFVRELGNGMTLLAQPMEHVSSAAMTLVLPAGAAYDPPGSGGAASVACEWCLRGAGGRGTRQLNDALDGLGCQHYETVRSEHVVLGAAQLGRNLPEVLAIFADIVRRPRLEDATFEPSRALVEQDLVSLEDEPAHKCTLLLRERFYPMPLGQCAYGTGESLAALSPHPLRGHVARQFTPAGALLGVAGSLDWPALSGRVEELFGDWRAAPAQRLSPVPAGGGVTVLPKKSAQVHIALAHRAAPIRNERYYAARMAEMVLSGGASSRLHTEVREKRGLVYHVSCTYHSLRDHAGMFTYAGTRPELAQQTLDVTVGELRRLAEGVGEDELARARTQLRSALVMQAESTSSRSRMLTSDWHHLGRIRGLEEISAAVGAVKAADVLDYVREYPAADFTALAIGPEELDASVLRG